MTSQNNSDPTSDSALKHGSRRPLISRILRRLILLPLIGIAGLYFLSMTAGQPENIGISNGQLSACPDSPNCVSTTASIESQKMLPINFSGDSVEMLSKIKSTITKDFPRAKLITETGNYLHFEFTSPMFRFVDDVEFLINDKELILHFRSASRVGHSDLGANRKRMSKICESLKP